MTAGGGFGIAATGDAARGRTVVFTAGAVAGADGGDAGTCPYQFKPPNVGRCLGEILDEEIMHTLVELAIFACADAFPGTSKRRTLVE